MKIHRTTNGIHISIDMREPHAEDEIIHLRFAMNGYGPLVREVDKLDKVYKEFRCGVSTVSGQQEDNGDGERV